MRNQIRSGRELPHVEKLYFIPTNLQLIILDSLHFLDEIHCWEPDQNRNGAYGNPIASSQRICTTCGSTLIYIGNRRKKEKKKQRLSDPSKSHTPATTSLWRPPTRSLRRLGYKTDYIRLFLFHYIILIDKAIETLAQS